MHGLRNFAVSSLIGGILVILPAIILGVVFNWIFTSITDLISPLTNYALTFYDAPKWIVNLIVIGLILLSCFIIGSFISTKVGHWLHEKFDRLAEKAPGYRLTRDIVQQLFGDKSDSPLRNGDVALVRAFGTDNLTAMTGIVSAKHENGWYTIFVPTGPNPTTGFIFHVAPEQVHILSGAKTDGAIKTIIACGAGSQHLPGLSSALATFNAPSNQ